MALDIITTVLIGMIILSVLSSAVKENKSGYDVAVYSFIVISQLLAIYCIWI